MKAAVTNKQSNKVAVEERYRPVPGHEQILIRATPAASATATRACSRKPFRPLSFRSCLITRSRAWSRRSARASNGRK
jgi:hypothetical protein